MKKENTIKRKGLFGFLINLFKKKQTNKVEKITSENVIKLFYNGPKKQQTKYGELNI